MSSKEWVRLFLVAAASNGWWAFSRWPRLGTSEGDTVGPLICLGVLPSLALAAWAILELAARWGDQ